MRKALMFMGALSVVLVQWGCDQVSTPEPASMEVVSERDNQQAYVGTPLDEPVQVQVIDDEGNVYDAGLEVEWSVLTGGGTVSPATSISDNDGIAGSNWTLGMTEGEQTLLAFAAGVDSVTITATALPDTTPVPGSLMVVSSSNNQQTYVNSVLPLPVKVRVLDMNGITYRRGLGVDWSVVTGGGSVSPEEAFSGTDGMVQTVWTLGGEGGVQTLRASAAGVDSVVITAVALPDTTPVPGSLQVVSSSNNQQADVGTTLPLPLQVLVLNTEGEVYWRGMNVAWTVLTGGGSVSPDTVRSGTDGIAEAVWTLGSVVGEQTVRASVAGLDSVVFTATGLAKAASLTIVGGNGQSAEPNTTLPTLLKVRVLDTNGDPYTGGLQVDWSLLAGGGSLSSGTSTSDGGGYATTSWTLGSLVGTQAVLAGAGSLVPVTFYATALPDTLGPAIGIVPATGSTVSGSPDDITVTLNLADRQYAGVNMNSLSVTADVDIGGVLQPDGTTSSVVAAGSELAGYFSVSSTTAQATFAAATMGLPAGSVTVSVSAEDNVYNQGSASSTFTVQVAEDSLVVGDATVAAGSSSTVQVRLRNSEVKGGLQFTLSFDDSLSVTDATAILGGRVDGFTVSHNGGSKPGEVTVIVYDASGGAIPIGKDVILELTFSAAGGAASGSYTISVTEAKLSDTSGSSSTAIAGQGGTIIVP